MLKASTPNGRWSSVHNEALNFPYLHVEGKPVVFVIDDSDGFECPKEVILAADKMYHNELKHEDCVYVEAETSQVVFSLFSKELVEIDRVDGQPGKSTTYKFQCGEGAAFNIETSTLFRKDRELYFFNDVLQNEKSPEDPFQEIQKPHDYCPEEKDNCGRIKL